MFRIETTLGCQQGDELLDRKTESVRTTDANQECQFVRLQSVVIFAFAVLTSSQGLAQSFIKPVYRFGGDEARREPSRPRSAGDCTKLASGPEFVARTEDLHKISIFLQDDRTNQTQSKDEVRAIGQVISSLRPAAPNQDQAPRDKLALSTGFLIAPCIAITNYHAALGETALEAAPTQSRSGTAVVKVSNVTVKIAGKTHRAESILLGPGATPNTPRAGDWAFLYLPSCPGNDPNVGWMDIADEPFEKLKGREVKMAGFHDDRMSDGNVWIDPSCRIHDSHETSQQKQVLSFEHDCASRPGTSGSPIYYLGEDGRPKVVGLALGAQGDRPGELQSEYKPEIANLAVNIMGFRGAVQRWLEQSIPQTKKTESL